MVAGSKNRTLKPRDYLVAGAWPYATIDHHAARVAQAFARPLEEVMQRRDLSAKRLAAARTCNRQTIANVLAGRVWPDTMTMANLEAAVGVRLFPAFDDEDVAHPPKRPPHPPSTPSAASAAMPASAQPNTDVIAEIEEVFLGHRFSAAPWRLWLDAEEAAPEPAGRDESNSNRDEHSWVLANLPFLHPSGVLTCLRLLAEESRWEIQKMVLALCEAEDTETGRNRGKSGQWLRGSCGVGSGAADLEGADCFDDGLSVGDEALEVGEFSGADDAGAADVLLAGQHPAVGLARAPGNRSGGGGPPPPGSDGPAHDLGGGR